MLLGLTGSMSSTLIRYIIMGEGSHSPGHIRGGGAGVGGGGGGGARVYRRGLVYVKLIRKINRNLFTV